ncbi:MAG TPA: Na+/H+ antiporter NhaA, partial [Acidobacteriota bacterium]|nr:Na+/H+ antiporter NhaA [Acidobacteriota bacterium]
MRDRLIQRNRPIERITRPFEEFTRMEGSAGILLVIAAAIALAWANSPLSESYFHLWEMEMGLSVGEYALTYSLHHW